MIYLTWHGCRQIHSKKNGGTMLQQEEGARTTATPGHKTQQPRIPPTTTKEATAQTATAAAWASRRCASGANPGPSSRRPMARQIQKLRHGSPSLAQPHTSRSHLPPNSARESSQPCTKRSSSTAARSSAAVETSVSPPATDTTDTATKQMQHNLKTDSLPDSYPEVLFIFQCMVQNAANPI